MPILTKKLVESLVPKDKEYLIWDDKISGFAVKATPTGKKSYLLKYRTMEGRQRKPSIGVHGNITCEEARKIAEKWHGLIANNIDPLSDIDEMKKSISVSELCDRFITDHSAIHKKKLGLKLDQSVINKYIKPSLGTLKVVAVTRQDIQKFHLSLKDIPAHANRILRVMSKMFNLAEDWGYRQQNSNPVMKVERYKEESRERYLTPLELKKLNETIAECLQDNSENIHLLSYIRLLLLTGARSAEIRNAKWDWVNLKRGTLSLPDSKTGKKTIYLAPAAIQVLEETPKIKNNPYIVVGKVEGQQLISPQKPWKRIKERTSFKLIKEGDFRFSDCNRYDDIQAYCKDNRVECPIGIMDVRLHDLRHTYASICVTQGISLQMVSKLLGHARASTSERYAHLAHDPISNAAAQVGNFISGKNNS